MHNDAVASRAIKFLNRLHQAFELNDSASAPSSTLAGGGGGESTADGSKSGGGSGGGSGSGSASADGGLDTIKEVRVQYISMCMKELEAGSKVKLERPCMRALALLEQLLDDTEQSGTVGLPNHASLSDRGSPFYIGENSHSVRTRTRTLTRIHAYMHTCAHEHGHGQGQGQGHAHIHQG